MGVLASSIGRHQMPMVESSVEHLQLCLVLGLDIDLGKNLLVPLVLCLGDSGVEIPMGDLIIHEMAGFVG